MDYFPKDCFSGFNDGNMGQGGHDFLTKPIKRLV